MPLTQGANYAFHALIRLALLPPGEVRTVDQVAQALGASPSYMAKLLQQMVRARLVTSQRGSRGGYGLARPADAITLGDVVVALGGGRAGEAPVIPACSSCPLAPTCPVKAVVQLAGEKITEVFSRVNVGHAAQLLAGLPSRRRAAEPNSVAEVG